MSYRPIPLPLKFFVVLVWYEKVEALFSYHFREESNLYTLFWRQKSYHQTTKTEHYLIDSQRCSKILSNLVNQYKLKIRTYFQRLNGKAKKEWVANENRTHVLGSTIQNSTTERQRPKINNTLVRRNIVELLMGDEPLQPNIHICDSDNINRHKGVICTTQL